MIAASALLGLLFGSFVGVLVDRVPVGATGVLTGRSSCGSCGARLEALDLIPVISWVTLRGRCRHCGAQIGLLPLVVEVVSAALFVVVILVTEDPWRRALLCPFLALLFGLTVIDLEHHRLPNAIVYPCVAAAAAVVVAGSLSGAALSPGGALVGALGFGGGLLMIALVSRGGMGMGDVKLAALIGLVVGSVDLPSVAVAAGSAILFGGAVAVGALLRGAGRRSALPFGPMLAAGALVAVVAGPAIAAAYMRLLT